MSKSYNKKQRSCDLYELVILVWKDPYRNLRIHRLTSIFFLSLLGWHLPGLSQAPT